MDFDTGDVESRMYFKEKYIDEVAKVVGALQKGKHIKPILGKDELIVSKKKKKSKKSNKKN